MNKFIQEVDAFCTGVDTELYEKQVNSKWTIKENLEHIYLSTNPVAKGLTLPKLTFLGFRSKNGSRSMERLTADYLALLEKGAKSTDKYVPAKNPSKLDKRELLKKWNKLPGYFESGLAKWSEDQLDKYRVPHPLLGKLTFREMLYFTIHHIRHHLNSMKKVFEG
ncbi:MAG: DinB family protein [Cyclobacteriaceae bacterium]